MSATAALSGNFDFSPETVSTEWRTIDYPDGPGGFEAPVLGAALPDVDMLLVSQSPAFPPAVEILRNAASGFHMAAVVLIDENLRTLAGAPATITVDLVSLDLTGGEIDRATNIVLNRLDGDDDSTRITYGSDPSFPIMLVDTALDPQLYPDLLLLHGVAGGKAIIVPNFLN